ncbi:hypothetical protein KAR91_34600 [Candidatus Pacearchaeota archaeon]|nr:hypothetical protein [Candidatus Pacearchaeota archaeon]
MKIDEDMRNELPPNNCPRPNKSDYLAQGRIFESLHTACANCHVFVCPYIDREEVHAPGI